MLGRLRLSLRRWALVGLVLAMVVSAGAIAMVGASRATGSQANVHRSDRLALAQSLATLAAGYFQQLETSQLGVAELLPQRVSDQPAAARPDALARAVGSLSGSPMAVEATGITPVLTATGAVELARAWPAMAPGMAAGLAAGGAAVSGVEWIGGRPTVVIATGPGASSPGAPALVVAYQLADLPIAAYVQQLRIAPGAVPYLLDRSGRLLTSPVTAQVGRPAPEVARAEAAGRQTPAVVQAGGPFPQVVAVVPVGEGGWHLVILQPAPGFYGALWHANNRFRWLLLGLLIVVAGALLWLHARRQAALHAIADMAVRDPLTSLPNRMAFTQALGKAMDRHCRDGVDLALLFCDLDGFKTVNDQLGHDAGDLLLMAAAERIRAVATATGGVGAMVARLGGDEFTVLLEGRQVRDRATAAARAVTEAVADTFLLKGHEVAVGISVGVAYAEPGRDLLRDADLAMYRMKAVRKAAREAGAPDRFATSPSAQMRAV